MRLFSLSKEEIPKILASLKANSGNVSILGTPIAAPLPITFSLYVIPQIEGKPMKQSSSSPGKAEALGMRLQADAFSQYGEVMLMLILMLMLMLMHNMGR